MFKPAKNYEIKLKISDLDYSQDVYKIRIVTSLNSPYQLVGLNLFLDPQDMILEQIFGQEPINLSIILLKETGIPYEQIDFELMFLKSDFQVPQTAKSGKQIQKDRTTVSLITVCRKAFKTMTTTVNDVIMEKTVKDAFSQLVSDYTEAEIEYDEEGQNEEQIDQIIIPPTTLYRSFKYLDNTFGIYDGIPVIHCNYENKIFVKNLTKKMTKNQTFTIYHLAMGGDQKKIIENTTDGKNFYTYDKLESGYSGNSNFATNAKNVKTIVKPKNGLYKLLEHDLETVCKEKGLIFNNDEMFFDDNLSDRTKYNIDHTGYDDSDTFIVSKLSKKVANMTTLSFGIERNLHILNLMNVGECVKVNSGTLEYADLTGKYILKSSDINFGKDKTWHSTCRLHLMRTNKTI